MPVGKPTPQTIATKKYEKKAGWMSKSYKLKREVVEAFWFIYAKYNHNKIVLDYYAKEMITGILSEKYPEEQIHNNFKTPEELTKIG